MAPSLGWGWLTSSLDSWGQTSPREGLFSRLEFSTASLCAGLHTLLFDPLQLLSRVSRGLGGGEGREQRASTLSLPLHFNQDCCPCDQSWVWGGGLSPPLPWDVGNLWSCLDPGYYEALRQTRWAVSRGQRWDIRGGQDSGDQGAKQSHY